MVDCKNSESGVVSKKTAVEIDFCSFDHHYLRSRNARTFFFFLLRLQFWEFLEHTTYTIRNLGKKTIAKIAMVCLTTDGCSRQTIADSSLRNWDIWNFGAYNIPLERYFLDLSNDIIHASKFLNLQSPNVIQESPFV